MKKKILFTYDLNKESTPAKRQKLRDDIKATFPTHWRRLTTTWIVETEHSAKVVADWLLQSLDSNDELFVVDITGQDAWWFGIDKAGSDWLSDVLNR